MIGTPVAAKCTAGVFFDQFTNNSCYNFLKHGIIIERYCVRKTQDVAELYYSASLREREEVTLWE